MKQNVCLYVCLLCKLEGTSKICSHLSLSSVPLTVYFDLVTSLKKCLLPFKGRLVPDGMVGCGFQRRYIQIF